MNIRIEHILLAIFISLMLQKFLAIPQMKGIVNHINKLGKRGICGYGIGRSKLGFKKYYLIIADNEGCILNAEKLEGWTVLAKFRPDRKIKEKSIYEICSDKTQEVKQFKNPLENAKYNAALNILDKMERRKQQTHISEGKEL